MKWWQILHIRLLLIIAPKHRIEQIGTFMAKIIEEDKKEKQKLEK